MAFSPFSIFRRHQKALLAAVTLLAMFSFILMWGGKGDITELFTPKGGGKGTPVATLYGKKITDAKLQETRNQRFLADRFMRSATEAAMISIQTEAQKGLDKFDIFDRRRIQEALSHKRMAGARTLEGKRAAFQSDMEELRVIRASLLSRNKAEQAQFLSELLWTMETEDWLLNSPRGELYFGGNNGPDSLLDFLMWHHQADRLGITLTDADVRNEINRDLLNRDPLDGNEKKDAEKFGRYLGMQSRKVTVKDMYNALREEYRVAMAQAALVGYLPGVRGFRRLDTDTNQVPAVVTPAQFWSYYKENRTTLKVDLLPVPVSDFLPQVPQPGPKDEEALRGLFKDYKDNEQQPDSNKPGFKVPRRLRIEWVAGRQNEPHFRDQARHLLKAEPFFSLFGTAGSTFAGGGGPAVPAMQVLLPLTGNAQLASAYEQHFKAQASWWDDPSRGGEAIHDRSLDHPVNAVASIGQTLGSAGTGGNLVSGPLAFLGSAAFYETQTRARLATTTFLAGAGLNPFTTVTTLPAAVTPQPLPYPAVKDRLEGPLEENLARSLMFRALAEIRDEVAKARGSKQDVAKVMKEKVAQNGLTHGEMTQARDRYTLADDPALANIKATLPMSASQFAADVFGAPGGLYLPLFPRPPLPPQMEEFAAQFPQLADQVRAGALFRMERPFVYWKVEDKEAYVPSFEEARPKVVEAWRMDQARQLAKAEANKLAAAAHKAGIDADKVLRDEAARHASWGSVHELDNVAQLIVPKQPLLGGPVAPTVYSPYEADRSLKLPSDFVDGLMRYLKEKGDTTVVANRPADVYYVVLLRDRVEPSEKQFYTAYSETPQRDELWVRFERGERNRYRQKAIEQLRLEASPDGVKNGRWSLPPKMREEFEGRARGDE